LADTKGAGKGGFFAEVIAGDGLAFPEFFFNISRQRGKSNLLRVALHTTISGIDFLASHGESRSGRRENSSGGLIGNGLEITEIFNRVIDESQPCGAED
jgi:hypothetical protein